MGGRGGEDRPPKEMSLERGLKEGGSQQSVEGSPAEGAPGSGRMGSEFEDQPGATEMQETKLLREEGTGHTSWGQSLDPIPQT